LLSELTITNFAIIDRIQLTLVPGLSVLTGETGAGKSIIIDAVSTLLGGRADAELIRAGTEGARVEGIFVLPPTLREELTPLLQEQGLQDDSGGELILAREINLSGRNVCRVNGRAVPLSVLAQLGERLVDIHGQSEHLSLLRVKEHLNFLDRYAGLQEQRAAVAEGVRALRRVREELASLHRDERELARRADLLQYQVHEIEDAQLLPDEEDELLNERKLLLNAERLSELSHSAYQTLAGGEEQHTIADLLDSVLRDLTELERLDAQVAAQRQVVEETTYQLEDLARMLRSYRDGVEFNTVRLQAVEERLDLIHGLKRKYGGCIPEILRFAQEAARELHAITHNEERMAELEQEQARLVADVGAQAAALSAERRAAAERLSTGIERELDELSMKQAHFVVDIQWKEAEEGLLVEGKNYAFDLTGIDRVEFLISPNVGEPPKPLAKIASGGETSRLMLALKAVLSAADQVPTLIFDEIDQGIGGRAGGVVGLKLWGLTSEHQVLCVTHLPQLACYGDTHFQVDKAESEGRTVTRVRMLEGQERIEELAAMLGGPAGKTQLRSAEEMFQETLTVKSR
jgi:DNA repair protein RecN (Recombination protein N)